MDAIRKASSTLFAAVCSVAALHEAENPALLQVCLPEYRLLISSAVFEKRNTEYIRALCIGPFWFLDISRILSSDAIRRAADARLHRHFHGLSDPATVKSKDQIAAARDRVRLWYLLFVCDQHLSILHNRDCLTQSERDIIRDRDTFLESELTTRRDIRIVSQVSLLQIMCQIRDTFGSERMEPLATPLLVQFNHFSRELDRYKSKYLSRFELDPDIGNFPHIGLLMHYQFGKLYLGHYAFHGLKDSPVPMHFLPAARMANEAAMDIFEMINHVELIWSNLVGVPHYFHVIISFAGHLLLEVCVKHREELRMTVENDLQRIRAAIGRFISMPTLPQHPLTRVTTGLMRRLSQCATSPGIESVMTGSPFGTLQEPYASALNFNTTTPVPQAGAMGNSNGQLGAFGADDSSLPDFGNFAFQDLPLDFNF